MIPDVAEGVDLDADGRLDATQATTDIDHDGHPDGPDGPDMDADGIGDFVDPHVDLDGDLLPDTAAVELIKALNLYDPFG